jgi:hypothetical protein
LLDEAASLLVDEGTTNVIEGSNTALSPQDMVTEIITVGDKPGMEEAYRAWADRVRQMEEARFPGYQGLQLQPPPSQGCKTTGSRCYASIPQSISTPGSSPTLAAPLAWVLVPAANRALDSWLRPARPAAPGGRRPSGSQ